MKSKKQFIFSLPVHEQYNVVLNQIENINHFCSDHSFVIVLHLSKHFKLTENQIQYLSEQPNLIINPLRMYSGYLDGCLLRIHIENSKFALANFEFNHIVFLSSNMMFINSMPELNSRIGTTYINARNTTWNQGKSAFKDLTLKKILKKFDPRTKKSQRAL